MSIARALESDAVLIGAAIVGIYFLSTKAGQQLVANVAEASVNAAGNAATGAVIGIGKAVGVPATNLDQCQRDIDAGDVWAASFSCPAGRWLAFEKSKPEY